MADPTEVPRLTITKVVERPEGYVTARVSANGATVDVDNRYGSWHAIVKVGHGVVERREVLPSVAAALCKRTRRKGSSIRRSA